MSGQPSFDNTDLVLNINTDSNTEKNINCSIYSIENNNYTLICESNEDIDTNNLQSAYSKIGDDILLINFDSQNEEGNSDSIEGTDSSDVITNNNNNNKSNGGLSRGGIVIIIIASLSAFAAIIFIVYFCIKGKGNFPNAKVKDITNYPFGSTTYINE